MNRTKIEWTDYTWNPVTGCKKDCWYCYVKRIVGYDRKPAFHEARIYKPQSVKKPGKIFVCSTADLFGEWISSDWIERILLVVRRCPQHTFQFLTKNPERYTSFDFPKNCWLGQTVVEKEDYKEITNKNISFVSFEPLLNDNIGDYRFPAAWYIIGGLTPQPKHSKLAIDKILSQASYFGVPVFIKANANYPKIRQEFPE